MDQQDLRVLLYLSVMFVVVTCFGLFFSLIFVSQGAIPQVLDLRIKPGIVILSILVASINGLAANIISEYLLEALKGLPYNLKYILPVVIFLLTLIASILVALASNG